MEDELQSALIELETVQNALIDHRQGQQRLDLIWISSKLVGVQIFIAAAIDRCQKRLDALENAQH